MPLPRGDLPLQFDRFMHFSYFSSGYLRVENMYQYKELANLSICSFVFVSVTQTRKSLSWRL